MTPLVYLAPVAWRSLWQRPQRLASALARHFQLTYVDPVGLRSLRWSDLRRWRPSPSEHSTPPSGMELVRPRYLPWQHELCAPLNRRWLLAQLRRAVPSIRDGDFQLWIGAPNLAALALLVSTRPRRVIFDCMDRYEEFHHGAAQSRIASAARSVLHSADVVFASSVPLAQELAAQHHHVVFAPNGVDYRHFAVAMPRGLWQRRRRQDLKVIGFHGTLGEWLDYELLAALARERPAWRWEFLGPVHSSAAKRLFAIANVRHRPSVPYAELPHRLAEFDVGVIPFARNRLTHAALPVKLGEYLAAGLPVVASRLASLDAVPGHVTLAETKVEWLAALDAALQPQMIHPKIVAARRRLSAARSWDLTVDTILAALGAADTKLTKHVSSPRQSDQRSAA